MTITGPDIMKNIIAKMPTLLLVLAAIVVAYLAYQRWIDRPWTRDGQVRADIVKIAPRVSGYIVEVAVKDNQFVRKGELLFSIDPSSFQLSVDTAQVQLKQARENVGALAAGVKAAAARVLESEAAMVAARAMIKQQQAALANARAESGRATRLANEKAGSVENAQKKAAMLLENQAAVDSARASLSQAAAALTSSQADLDQAQANLGEPGDANVRILEAMVQLEEAQLKLSWTSMNAPFDGYITNLDVNEGAFGVSGTPLAAFVDSSSFRADGFCQKCDFDEPGELLIRITETTRFEGYTNKSATEKKVLQNAFEEGDAYFRSGDLLRLDAEGFFYFVDRIGDTFRWKGENVSTSEVAEVVSAAAGIEEANVYGVSVSGTDGRAGMAALVTNDDFELDALSGLVEEGLASYARPIFIRILPQMEITGTFKHRKVDLVREGFDPATLSDQLFYRDPGKGRYLPLDTSAFERIESGEIRL